MPIYNIQDSKFKIEVISIVQDFSDMLTYGDTIVGIPLITITVLSGIDFFPSDMLYKGASVTNGEAVEQRIREGIPGVIYNILFEVSTTFGFTLEKESFVAVLPLEGNLTPIFTPVYLTSNLYPYEFMDKMRNTMIPFGGNLLGTYRWSEFIQIGMTPVSGTLVGTQIIYNIFPEQIQNSMSPISGTLVGGQVIYNIPVEQIKNSMAPISGTLIGTQVIYAMRPEQIQNSMLPISGTLV